MACLALLGQASLPMAKLGQPPVKDETAPKTNDKSTEEPLARVATSFEKQVAALRQKSAA